MAKKKKPALPPEEKLQQALVPIEGQPYPVPGNWCYFYFTSLIDIEGGTQPPKSQFVSTYKSGYIRLVQIRDFATETYKVYVPDTPKMRHFKKDDIMIARYGASLGKICTGLEGAYNVALVKTIFSDNILYRKYVYWMLQSESFQAPLMQISRTAQAGFNKGDLSTFAMPLPPLPEQRRIVACIESLFQKLEEAQEKLQAVVDGFETRKAAILHKAFTGELTERWRKEHRSSEWVTSTFGQYTNSQYGYTESATQKPIGPKFLRITDIQNGTVDWDKVPYCNITKDDFEKYMIKPDDIMIARTGATTGKSYLIVDDVKAVFASYLIRLTMKGPGLIATYLYYFMQSSGYWQQITEFSTGIAQPGVNAKKLQRIEFPIPPIEEQREIVFTLNKILKKEQQAKSIAEAALGQVGLMKKAILARAFRGELGTNDPAEENAAGLVRALLMEGRTP